MTKIICC